MAQGSGLGPVRSKEWPRPRLTSSDSVAPGWLIAKGPPVAIQRWVTDRLRRALSRRLDVEAEPRVDLDVAGRVRMEP